ncbi:MAG: nickel pincer cofactor biosynthesis protein LarB [Armatimonadota bacterium]|nr:nickel pincer cofactor biosynthesis protein LarB [Armatimonadota bacterium]
MNAEHITRLLRNVSDGSLSVEEAVHQLRVMPYEDLGFAKIDTHRALRAGFPEVIFCQGKTREQVAEIMLSLTNHNSKALATRATREMFDAVSAVVPDAVWHEAARLIVVDRADKPPDDGKYVMVLCAGTADMPVAEEAAVTAETMGSRVERAYDVGVAGLHRLLDRKDKLLGANVLVVIAGMEGALASVVGGLVNRPVIAVPTSIGYGASFEGIAPLLTMLNCCAAGVAVVNIDNGFGAGYFAHLVNK